MPSAAGAIGRVIEAARRALDSFDRRIAGFGVGAERIHTVDEEDLRQDPQTVWPEICRRIGVDDSAAAVQGMIRPTATPWSLRSGRF